MITASMVPVCSMTKSRVIWGAPGSSPSSFSATTTWAELETGSSSATPWIRARSSTLTRIMAACSGFRAQGKPTVGEAGPRFPARRGASITPCTCCM